MVIDIKTASWLELLFVGIGMVVVTGTGWFVLGFWDRMWSESLVSRSVDRRFLRWQHFAFRGHYPFGHWGGPDAVMRVHVVTFIGRMILLIMLLAVLGAIASRAFADLTSRNGAGTQQSQLGFQYPPPVDGFFVGQQIKLL